MDFTKFCKEKGILKQVTVPHSSQMNGVAEIKHQVLQYQARTMLLHANLHKCYWAEAVETANYILNRLPSSALQGQIPYSKWSGHKPSLKHLRVFGAPAYVYIPRASRTKFDPRSELYILVGYLEDLKAYKLIHHVPVSLGTLAQS